jgi:hypothetical protein
MPKIGTLFTLNQGRLPTRRQTELRLYEGFRLILLALVTCQGVQPAFRRVDALLHLDQKLPAQFTWQQRISFEISLKSFILQETS